MDLGDQVRQMLESPEGGGRGRLLYDVTSRVELEGARTPSYGRISKNTATNLMPTITFITSDCSNATDVIDFDLDPP